MLEAKTTKLVEIEASESEAARQMKRPRDMTVTEMLEAALDDVKNGRMYTVDPNNHRLGFIDLLETQKREFAASNRS